MTELEQLKADLATLEAARKLKINDNTDYWLERETEKFQAKIAELEAQPVEEWETAKEVLECWNKYTALPNQSHAIEVLKYATYLEARVAELERKGQS
jgi:hypothetical protein